MKEKVIVWLFLIDIRSVKFQKVGADMNFLWRLNVGLKRLLMFTFKKKIENLDECL